MTFDGQRSSCKSKEVWGRLGGVLIKEEVSSSLLGKLAPPCIMLQTLFFSSESPFPLVMHTYLQTSKQTNKQTNKQANKKQYLKCWASCRINCSIRYKDVQFAKFRNCLQREREKQG